MPFFLLWTVNDGSFNCKIIVIPIVIPITTNFKIKQRSIKTNCIDKCSLYSLTLVLSNNTNSLTKVTKKGGKKDRKMQDGHFREVPYYTERNNYRV